MPNIVKHSFIKGPKIAARAIAHINYIQHRPGEDKERGQEGPEEKYRRESARPLRVAGEGESPPGKASLDFKEAVFDRSERGRVVHKFILSPSEPGVNLDRYTQEVMGAIGKQKGQDLKYAWVVHENTDNPHAHVVVMGKDRDGTDVRFSKLDYTLMRHYGDRYLQREHGVEMDLFKDREIEFYARTHGHNLFTSSVEENLRFLERPESKSSWKSDEDFRHLLNINQNWNESLEGSREGQLGLGSTWMHDRGRLSEVHDLYQNSSNRELWQDVFDNTTDQQLKDYASKQLSSLEQQRQAVVSEFGEKQWLAPEKHDEFFKALQQQFANEWREIDQVLYPEKYLPQKHERQDIDLERVGSEDKIQLAGGQWITKFDSSELLDSVRSELWKGSIEERLPPEQFGKLCSWIGQKKAHGEDCFGEVPLKLDLDVEKPLDMDRLDNRSLSLDGLSDEMALESKSLQDLLSPNYESPELREIDEISESHMISIEDSLDSREPDRQTFEETIEKLESQEFALDTLEIERDIYPEERTSDEPFQVSYEIGDAFDSKYDLPDLDFEHDSERGAEEDYDFPAVETGGQEIEEICDIDSNGGEDYELEKVQETQTLVREEQGPPPDEDRRSKSDDLGR